MVYHQCFLQSQIAAGKRAPLPPGKKRCTCRQEVTPEEAKELIEDGEAVYIVVERTFKPFEMTCTLCEGDKTVKNCALCGGKGTVTKSYTVDINGDDIVAITVALKTPRTPTIEQGHIERAYVDGIKVAQDRIEAYGESNRDFINSLIVGYEPADDPKTGTGRRYDYGRSVIYTPEGK